MKLWTATPFGRKDIDYLRLVCVYINMIVWLGPFGCDYISDALISIDIVGFSKAFPEAKDTEGRESDETNGAKWRKMEKTKTNNRKGANYSYALFSIK